MLRKYKSVIYHEKEQYIMKLLVFSLYSFYVVAFYAMCLYYITIKKRKVYFMVRYSIKELVKYM